MYICLYITYDITYDDLGVYTTRDIYMCTCVYYRAYMRAYTLDININAKFASLFANQLIRRRCLFS